MKNLPWLAALIFFLSISASALPQEEIEISLANGSKLIGILVSRTTDELVIRCELGTLKLRPHQLSLTARDAFFGGGGVPADLEGEVRRLEALVKALQEENATLHSQLADMKRSPGLVRSSGSGGAPTSQAAPPKAARSHWLTSSSGVRHNSGCRWYKTSKGLACSASDGRACKQCGG